MTTYSGLSYTFSGAVSSLSSSDWIFFGMSAGWMARNNDFMLCGYIYQASTGYEQGICIQSVSISSSDFGSGVTLYVQFGSGLNGYLNDVYVVNHLEHFETFKLFKSTFGTDRYHCFDSSYNTDPHYISNGCGNGYVLPTETSETCDDQNTSSGDGCSSTCKRENLYKCTNTGTAGISSCTYVCRNRIYEPAYGEQCDDGNSAALDGCTSVCAIENGWDCSGSVAGSVSTCVPICGDNYRVAGEGCDDGNNTDNMGCKSDCSGPMNGWHCSGGSATSKDVCNEQCNDGYITTNEQCEDGNTVSLDGCSSTCQDEPGWTCTNNAAMTSTTCVPICGDNYRVKGEACDDGNNTDNKGCKNDCSGMINGWHCSGGSATSKDVCNEQCKDGYITISEQCEDGNLLNNDGCSSTCQIEVGWTCTNNFAMTHSTCKPICGDGLKVGPEVCDDGNKDDNKGCLNDCMGVIRGWYCSPGVTIASVCTTKLMDGIHIASEEGCDDGNNVDVGDGCSNAGIVDPKWICVDDILLKSICIPKCGDGKRDDSDEECDDYNYDNNDGCSSKCFIETGWQCFNGTQTNPDVCGKQPIARIDSVSLDNCISIVFSEKMQTFTAQNSTAFNISITGPIYPYTYTTLSNFSDSSTLFLNLTIISSMAGDDEEKFTIKFDQTQFKSIFGSTLLTSELSTSLNKKPVLPDVIDAIGSTTNTIMLVTMIIMISSNVLLSQSSELLWGFLNTIQIMYFFPLLQLYYPDNLFAILTYLSSSKLQIQIPQVEAFKSNIVSEYRLSENIDMPSHNDRFEALGYDSTSIFLSGMDIFSLMLQSMVICTIVFGLRAIFFTLRYGSSVYEEELRKLEAEKAKSFKLAEAGQAPEKQPQENDEIKININENDSRDIRIKRWIKKKIREMSYEYRFNFFLRITLQLFLETFILSLLNISYPKFTKSIQILSFLTSIVFICILILFLIWGTRFSIKNYKNFKEKERVNIPEYESMFGQYKTKNIPQACYNSYFMIRRMLYACIIIFLEKYPIMQAFSFTLICLPILAYQIVMNPFLDKAINVLMNINEISFVVIGIFFFNFGEPNSNYDQLNILGWTVIAIILFVIIVNLIVLWIIKILKIRQDFKEWWHAFKNKQSDEVQKPNSPKSTIMHLKSNASNDIPGKTNVQDPKEFNLFCEINKNLKPEYQLKRKFDTPRFKPNLLSVPK